MDEEIEPGEEYSNSTSSKKRKKYDWLAPYQYKKGQSGNPNGRPAGVKTLKQYAKERLESMTDEEREDFLHGIGKVEIWHMAEGNAHQTTDITSAGQPLFSDEHKKKAEDAIKSLISTGNPG